MSPLKKSAENADWWRFNLVMTLSFFERVLIWPRQGNYGNLYSLSLGEFLETSGFLWNLDPKYLLLPRLRLKGSIIKQCQLSVYCKILLTSRSQKYGELCGFDVFDCWCVRWRVEISQISAFISLSRKKCRLVGYFHVDFGVRILTISSFSSLKRALIWNNMLTVNVFSVPVTAEFDPAVEIQG